MRADHSTAHLVRLEEPARVRYTQVAAKLGLGGGAAGRRHLALGRDGCLEPAGKGQRAEGRKTGS